MKVNDEIKYINTENLLDELIRRYEAGEKAAKRQVMKHHGHGDNDEASHWKTVVLAEHQMLLKAKNMLKHFNRISDYFAMEHEHRSIQGIL